LLFNKFLFGCRYVPYLRRHSPAKLCDCAHMAFFASFLRPVFFSEPRAALSDLHSKFALGPVGHTMCRSMVDIQSPTAKNRRGKKEERKKKIETAGQKYNGLPYSIGRP